MNESRLQRAKRYLGGMVRKTALLVVPLALLGAASAKADNVVLFEEGWVYTDGSLGTADVFGSALSPLGGTTGVKLFGSGSCVSCTYLGLTWYGSFSSTTSSTSFTVPFTLIFNGPVGSGGWSLYGSGGVSLSGTTIGSFGSGGTYVGSGFATFDGAFFSQWQIDLEVRDLNAYELFLDVPNDSLDINPSSPSAVPEPGSMSMLLLGAGVTLAVARRRGKQ